MKIVNDKVLQVIEFLDGMELKGRSSLGRTKLKDSLSKVFEVVSKDQKDIITEYGAWIDEQKGEYDTSDVEMTSALDILFLAESSYTIDTPFLEDFEKALEEYDNPLSSTDADAYAVLYEELIMEKEND